MEHGEQEVQTSFTLGRTWRRLPEDMSQGPYGNHQRLESQQVVQNPVGKGIQDKGESSHYPSHRRNTEPDRAYTDSLRFTRSKPTKIPNGFTPFRHQNINYPESPFFTIPDIFQEKTRIKGEKQKSFQPEAERFIPNDPEAVGLGERSTQEKELALNTSDRISSPTTRNIIPTQNENSFLHLRVT
ncbi:hypothetical protein O181_009642 [Austropuccinia psidii MF-1]|uniref:Uncharacterized protein n=1 Tax=Austropuccinia psidii MF-1 TaxID=1389203 RepID=A0A9Q3BR46_9BASI|nr:hypothetical protein [Austropuccinia psidii MF-1]